MSQTIAGAIRNELERYGSASSVTSNSIGVGSTTGKWTHYLHYIPMGKNVVVS